MVLAETPETRAPPSGGQRGQASEVIENCAPDAFLVSKPSYPEKAGSRIHRAPFMNRREIEGERRIWVDLGSWRCATSLASNAVHCRGAHVKLVKSGRCTYPLVGDGELRARSGALTIVGVEIVPPQRAGGWDAVEIPFKGESRADSRRK